MTEPGGPHPPTPSPFDGEGGDGMAPHPSPLSGGEGGDGTAPHPSPLAGGEGEIPQSGDRSAGSPGGPHPPTPSPSNGEGGNGDGTAASPPGLTSVSPAPLSFSADAGSGEGGDGTRRGAEPGVEGVMCSEGPNREEDSDMSPEGSLSGPRRGAEPGSNRGGGPKTAEGKQTALANLQPDSAMTHGIYAYLARGTMPRCERCELSEECPYADDEELNPTGRCVIMQLVYDEQMAAMDGTEHLQGQPAYKLVMELRARLAATMVKINLQLGEIGLFRRTKDGLQAQSLLELQMKVMGRIIDVSKVLALTPQSAFQMKLPFGDGLSAIEVAMREAERDVIEGEFEEG